MGLFQSGWGRLGRDVEVQYSQSGFAFGKTSVACKIPRKNQDGTYGATEWVELTFLGTQAENAAKFVQKGHKIWFTGYPQTEEWEDKQNPGQKRKAVRVVVQQWESLEPNPNAQQGQGQQGGFQQGNQQGGFQQGNQQGGFQQGGGGFSQQGQPQQGGFNPNQPGNQQQFNPNQPGNQQPQGQPQQQGQPQGQGGFGQNFPNQQKGTGDDVPF